MLDYIKDWRMSFCSDNYLFMFFIFDYARIMLVYYFPTITPLQSSSHFTIFLMHMYEIWKQNAASVGTFTILIVDKFMAFCAHNFPADAAANK